MKNNFKICIIGLGYIGLPTALIINDKNYQVVGVDINSNLIENLKKNRIHLDEKGIKDYFSSSVKKK